MIDISNTVTYKLHIIIYHSCLIEQKAFEDIPNFFTFDTSFTSPKFIANLVWNDQFCQ